MGLGDHYISNGLVRQIYKDYKTANNTINLLCKKRFEENVKWMYQDLDLSIIAVPDDPEARQVFSTFDGEKISGFGFQGMKTNKGNEVFNEHAVYLKHSYVPKVRYEMFKFHRDKDLEHRIYEEIINFDEPYVFVADDAERGYIIDITKVIKEPIKIIRSDELRNYKIHELLGVVENAQSSHVMYSSFFLLIDALNIRPLYVHETYLKKIEVYMNPDHPQYKPMMKHWKKRNVTFV